MHRSIPRCVTALALAAIVAPTARLAAQKVIPGLDASAMDTTARPGDDFYKYANGSWDRRTQIPPELSSFGAFSIAAKQADANVAEIVHRAAAANAGQGTDTARSPTSIKPTSTRRRSSRAALVRSVRCSTASPPSRTRKPSRASSARTSAPTSIRSTTPFCTPTTRSASGSRRTSTIRAQRGVAPPGRRRAARPELLPRPVAARWPTCAPGIARTS